MKKLALALCIFLLTLVPCFAAEQFIGIGGGIEPGQLNDSAFDFTWGYEINEGQFIATTARMNGHFSEFTEDFLQEVVEITPIKLTITGIGSIGATAGEGTTKLDFGGGVGGLQDLTIFSDKLKNCSIFIGAKFMRNNFENENRDGGISRIIFEFVYRWGD